MEGGIWVEANCGLEGGDLLNCLGFLFPFFFPFPLFKAERLRHCQQKWGTRLEFKKRL